MQKSQSAISTFVQDSFSGIRVVKFFNKEKYIEKNYNSKVGDYMVKALDLAKTEAYFLPLFFCNRAFECRHPLYWWRTIHQW